MESKKLDVFERTLLLLYRERAAELGFRNVEFSVSRLSEDGEEEKSEQPAQESTAGCIVIRRWDKPAGLWLEVRGTSWGPALDRETLKPDYDVMDKYGRQEKREALEQWVFGGGPEPCHKLIDQIWSKQ